MVKKKIYTNINSNINIHINIHKMEQNLEKLTKKELINKISKMSKKNIVKMLSNQKGGEQTENNSSEVIIQPIIFNPLNMQNNKNKNKNIMRNNKIYEGVTDYKI